MLKCIFCKLQPPSIDVPKTVIIIAFLLFTTLLSCTYDQSYIKSLSNDITTQGFINDNCYQCIITAKPDPGIEGLVASRESAHINLMKSLERQCYDTLINATAQLQGISVTHSFQQCLLQQLKQYIDNKVIVVTYFNEDFSETAVVRIYENGLKQKLATLRCR
jgi:archaellum component FlaF (FlaF/FlaG flagellin family)